MSACKKVKQQRNDKVLRRCIHIFLFIIGKTFILISKESILLVVQTFKAVLENIKTYIFERLVTLKSYFGINVFVLYSYIALKVSMNLNQLYELYYALIISCRKLSSFFRTKDSYTNKHCQKTSLMFFEVKLALTNISSNYQQICRDNLYLILSKKNKMRNDENDLIKFSYYF